MLAQAFVEGASKNNTVETISNLELLNYLEELHTLELGIVRIKRNLSLEKRENIGQSE